MDPVRKLFRQIMGLKGSRQVTVVTLYLGARTFDITEGIIGYAPSHRALLLEHLEEAVSDVGGVIVRHFQTKKVLVPCPAGPRMLPVKHLFGVRAGRGGWIGASSQEMRAANETDAATGLPLAPEEAVAYLGWSAGIASGTAQPSGKRRPSGGGCVK